MSSQAQKFGIFKKKLSLSGAATHLVPNPFDPWSPTSSPPGQMFPIRIGPQPGPRISGSPQPVHLDKQNIPGTVCPGGPNFAGPFVHGLELVRKRLSRGTNQLGTICGGPTVRGPYSFGTKYVTASSGVGNSCMEL